MRRAFTLLEVLLALSIMGILVATIYPTVGWLLVKSKSLQYDGEASGILQEGLEIGYNVFLSDWTTASGLPDGDYYPAVEAPNKWILMAGVDPEVDARFTRKIEVISVCRNIATGEQVTGVCTGGAAIDTNSKKLVSTVTWIERGEVKPISATLLVTRMTD